MSADKRVSEEIVKAAWIEATKHFDSGIMYYIDGQYDGFKLGFEAVLKWRDEQRKKPACDSMCFDVPDGIAHVDWCERACHD